MKRSELLAARAQLQADIQVSQGHIALLVAEAGERGYTLEDNQGIAELQDGIARARHAISIIDQGLAAGLYEKEEN